MTLSNPAASASECTQPCKFLAIPPELRLRVYGLLPREQARAHYYGDAEELDNIKVVVYYAPSSVAILLTRRQVNKEATNTLLKPCELYIHLNYLDDCTMHLLAGKINQTVLNHAALVRVKACPGEACSQPGAPHTLQFLENVRTIGDRLSHLIRLPRRDFKFILYIGCRKLVQVASTPHIGLDGLDEVLNGLVPKDSGKSWKCYLSKWDQADVCGVRGWFRRQPDPDKHAERTARFDLLRRRGLNIEKERGFYGEDVEYD